MLVTVALIVVIALLARLLIWQKDRARSRRLLLFDAISAEAMAERKAEQASRYARPIPN